MLESTNTSGASSITAASIPGGWSTQTIALKGQSIQLVLPADSAEFLNHLGALRESQGEEDPYWARLWPAGVQLAEWVVRHDWPPAARTLDLGCGIGVVGIAALLAGLDVTFSDYVPIAVKLALENARRNGFSETRGLVFDWRRTLNKEEKFRIMLAADILYDRHLYPSIVDVITGALDTNGVCVIGDPGRYHVESFLELSVDAGLDPILTDEYGHHLSQPLAGKFQLITLSREDAQCG